MLGGFRSSALLLAITLGALWSHDQGWFFAPIEGLLKPKDRVNLVAVRHQLENFGWTFTLVSLSAAALWLSLTRSLWFGRMRAVAYQLVLVSVLHGFVSWAVVMPVIASGKSYRDFMTEVNQRVKPDDKLYLHGAFNSDAVVFYRGEVVDTLERPTAEVAMKIGKGDGFLIMPAQSWKEMQKTVGNLPPPLVTSTGKGPEGDAPLVLVQADVA